jgi:Tfp pilus assembly protein PilO
MWWFPALVFMVVVVGSLFVLLPQSTQLKESMENIEKTQQQLNQAQAKISEISQIDVTQLNRLENLAANALPEHKPYFEALVTLQQLAAETGIFLQDFKLDPGSLATESAKKTAISPDGSVKMSTKLSIMGTTESVSQFVERLQQSLPLVTITSISIGQNNNEEETDRRQADLSLDLYYAGPLPDKGKLSYEPLSQISESQQAVFDLLANYKGVSSASEAAAAISNFERTNIFSF